MNDTPLPPGLDASVLYRVPLRHRDDAAQEAWVAYLEGKDPKRAVWRYSKQEYRNERRKISTNDLAEDDKIDGDRVTRKF